MFLNFLLISSIIYNIGSRLYISNGIFNKPSKYWRAFVPESSDFAFTSFNFSIAFSFTELGTFIKHICCSRGILLKS